METKTYTLSYIKDEQYESKEAQKVKIYFEKDYLGEITLSLREFTAETLIQLSEIILSIKDHDFVQKIRNKSIVIFYQINSNTKFVIKNKINNLGLEDFTFASY